MAMRPNVKKNPGRKPRVVELTVEHKVDGPTVENGHTNGYSPSKDRQRPSQGDSFGRPSSGGGANMALPVIQVTRDEQDWMAQGIIDVASIAMGRRMLAKKAIRVTGRLDPELLLFQAMTLSRSESGHGLQMYERIARGEMMKQRAMGWFDRADAHGSQPPQVNGGPQ